MDDAQVAFLREIGLVGELDLSDAVERQDHVVSEDPSVIVRVHRPVGVTGPLPCLYSIHGGGYVIGDRSMDDAKFDRWCVEFSMVGVSVEYRLAPDDPYPAAIDDVEAGLLWVFEHAEALGINRQRVGITGVSAGGGLCAALGLRMRDRSDTPVAFQLLDCPMLDDRMQTASSQADGLVVWSRHSNSYGWRSYLGKLADGDPPADAAPARADDLAGLPPSYVCVGGADGFRDEDIDFAQRLMAAGVDTELHVYPGVPHGIEMWQGTEPARQYRDDQQNWLRRQLRRLETQ
jgi:acetyl esterase/lipase